MPVDLTEDELDFLMATLDLSREGRTDDLVDRVARGVPRTSPAAQGIPCSSSRHTMIIRVPLACCSSMVPIPTGSTTVVRRRWAQLFFDAAPNRYSCCWIGVLTRSPANDRRSAWRRFSAWRTCLRCFADAPPKRPERLPTTPLSTDLPTGEVRIGGKPPASGCLADTGLSI